MGRPRMCACSWIDCLQLITGGTAASRRKRAIVTLAGLVGALTLARAVDDPDLSNEILAAAREAFGKA